MGSRSDENLIRLQWAVVRAQKYWFPGIILRWFCRVGCWIIGRRLMNLPGVEAVYVRHTHPGSPSFVPGHSDLDLTVVLSDQAAKSPEVIESVAGFLGRRRLFYYYLSPEDARITTVGELARMTGKWPPSEILVGTEDWTLLAGSDVRKGESKIQPAERIPLHPEFNRWWGHILQNYLLLSMPGLENRYHRVFFRGAIKQAAYFMIARGRQPPQKESITDWGLAAWVLEDQLSLRAVLAELEQTGFWEGEDTHIRERIFHEVLRITENFYAGVPGGSPVVENNNFTPVTDEFHAGAYDALASRLGALPHLKSRLAGVLAYPTPYCHPYFYQVHLLLPENISVEELVALAGIVRQEFNGREFESNGHHFSITLIPVRVYQAPPAFRGSPFPFMTDHLQRYGRVLFGPPLVAMAEFGNQERVDWCRIFLPFFVSNLNRRVEYSSRTLNFCHIAAVHLFLVSGAILTDLPALRARHVQVFGQDSPPSEVWDYLLRDKPGRVDTQLYRAASLHLAWELEKVEQLLANPAFQPPSNPEVERSR